MLQSWPCLDDCSISNLHARGGGNLKALKENSDKLDEQKDKDKVLFCQKSNGSLLDSYVKHHLMQS